MTSIASFCMHNINSNDYQRCFRIYISGSTSRNLKSNLHSVPLSKEDEYIYTRFWRAVNKLEPFRKRILYLKYDYNFDVINSNKKIAGLCGCSEETVRKYVNKVIVNFTQTPLIR